MIRYEEYEDKNPAAYSCSDSDSQCYCLYVFARCGGCTMRHIKYEETLKMKQNAVQSLVNKTLKNKIDVKETLRNGKSISL